MPDFKIPSEHHLMIIALKGQPFPKFDKPETEKITRDAFIYLSPDEGEGENYAKCGTCWLFDKEEEKCCILGPDTDVDSDDSCCLYTYGTPVEGQPIVARITPEDAGFVKREVRCENCAHSNGSGKCLLYAKLNEKLPDLFDLDESIDATACCNANTPKSSNEEDKDENEEE